MYFTRFILASALCITIIDIIGFVQCADKHETNIKNITDLERAKPKTNQDPFKKDIRKYLRVCGINVSGEDDNDDVDNHAGEVQSTEEVLPKGQQPHPGQMNANWAYENKKKNKGTYPTHYGKNKKGGNRSDEESDEEESDDSEDDYRGSSNRRKGNNRNNNNRNNRKGGKRRPSNDYDDSRDNCEDDRRGGSSSNNRRGYYNGNGNSNNKNQWGMSSGSSGSGWSNGRGGYDTRYNNNNRNYGYSSDPYGMYGGSTDLWGSRGYTIYGGRLTVANRDEGLIRSRRQLREEHPCPSQCVFGYMEMLDDNRVPAETEVIRYFQNKITNNTERMRLIKLARKCFAKLSTAGMWEEIPDNEDGCQFSKELARCLQIEIKGETK